jgi:hypothetical protein
MEKKIEILHKTKSGKISDKWASYLPYYDGIFLPLQDSPIRMLEIGVQNGGSLETWAEYFGRATLLIGCDIDENCAKLQYSDPRIKIVIGDANSAPAFSQVVALTSQLDIVIDDGSHVSRDIINSFINYFPLLSPGGVYVVEDAHCLYMNDFGGGFSWRSRKLALAAAEIADFRIPNEPEDIFIGRTIRIALESRYGCRFADDATATNFSTEQVLTNPESFGFHGVMHLPQVYRNALPYLVENLPERVLKQRMQLLLLGANFLDAHKKLEFTSCINSRLTLKNTVA